MKKLILKFLFLFYNYYGEGSSKSIAYFSALAALILTLFLNMFTILAFFGVVNRNSNSETAKVVQYLVGFLIFIPAFYILKNIFKEEEVLKIKMEKSTIRKGYSLVICYLVLSVSLLMWVSLRK